MNSRTIGDRLVTLRTKENLTQEQVAKDLGISTSAIGMYERGDRIPRDEIKIKIADYYNESVQDIFFDFDDTLRVN